MEILVTRQDIKPDESVIIISKIDTQMTIHYDKKKGYTFERDYQFSSVFTFKMALEFIKATSLPFDVFIVPTLEVELFKKQMNIIVTN